MTETFKVREHISNMLPDFTDTQIQHELEKHNVHVSVPTIASFRRNELRRAEEAILTKEELAARYLTAAEDLNAKIAKIVENLEQLLEKLKEQGSVTNARDIVSVLRELREVIALQSKRLGELINPEALRDMVLDKAALYNQFIEYVIYLESLGRIKILDETLRKKKKLAEIAA